MSNVILVVHLILALALIGVVLMQRSEGGGLGIGGGGGNVMTGRSAATALGKVTWALAIAFLATSITLTVFAARDTGSGSVLERLGGEAAPAPSADAPALPPALDILPPRASDAPAGPPRAD